MGKLTPQQEIFVQSRIKGDSQRKAYKKAYPHSENWKDGSVDTEASKLNSSPKVIQRYDELKQKVDEEAIMSREELLKGLRKAFYMALGVEPTPMIVKSIIEDVTEVEEVNRRNADLKSVASISAQIAKLEGWEINKVEHSGAVPIQIVDDIK